MVARSSLVPLERLAETQDWFFTAAQAAALGIARQSISKAAGRGEIQSIAWGMYRFAGTEVPPRRFRLWEAVLWPHAGAKTNAVLSHETALALHDMRDPNPDRVHLTLPRSFRIRREVPAWLEIHRDEIDEEEIVSVEGLPVTTIPRSIRDSADSLAQPELAAIISDAEFRGYDVDMPMHAKPARAKSRPRAVHRDAEPDDIVPREDIPDHLFAIPELDVSAEILGERCPAPWMTLGRVTGLARRGGLSYAAQRQCLLVPVGAFQKLHSSLSYVGNALSQLGQPGGVVYHGRDGKKYSYDAFHTFEFRGSDITGEPLVFLRETSTALRLAVNPDVILFLGLEEQSPGVWIDPRSRADVLVHTVSGIDSEIRIRANALRRYLRARQLSLIVAHFSQRLYFNAPKELMEAFVAGDLVIGSAHSGAKLLSFNTASLDRRLGLDPYLRRELHLWFEIKPTFLDADHAFDEEPPFDVYGFTLPTHDGLVAPARFTSVATNGGKFAGVAGDFMGRTYFRQEVLGKYEGAEGFVVSDDGSVKCGSYWGLYRSTARLGNDLLSTAIGDFAEGVPFEEWLYWQAFSVEPPSQESVDAMRSETSIIDAVNGLEDALKRLNGAYNAFAQTVGVISQELLWDGSLESLAGRQLKWHYPQGAREDEFLKRATLMSTLVIEGIANVRLRAAASQFNRDFHLGPVNGQGQRVPLGSRKMLERLALAAVIAVEMQPPLSTVATLTLEAEGAATTDADLEVELQELYARVREALSPLAFLYDLRTLGGVAHKPNIEEVRDVAVKLGLTREQWSRSEYVALVGKVTSCIKKLAAVFLRASHVIEDGVAQHG